ncbi:hypothetical protein VN97_g10173 [Penicillium thymicola]|uniref:Uncharacterized protein n=1 Tax=Penicillium thymicola TaxID=293382 RepID=A0AAI9T9V9_PENTH|nr:hypothetical protein VN97_g10173 [Penicillium thymicola]
MELSSPQQIIIATPRPRSAEDPLSNKRRKTVPSPESSQAKDLVIFPPPDTIHQRWAPERFTVKYCERLQPEDHLQGEESLPHGHPPQGESSLSNPTPPQDEKNWRFDLRIPLPSARQMFMPFDLREYPSKFLEPANNNLLFEIFPKTQAIEFDDRVLVYRFDELPPKPWPRQIARVPCYLTNDPHDNGPMIPIRHRSRSQIVLSPTIDLRDNEPAANLIFDLTQDFFMKANLPITEVQFWGHLVIIVLETEPDNVEVLQAVPKSIARCQCFYLFESEMERPTQLSAQRLKQVTPATIDNTQYKVLRPGVVLSSAMNNQGQEFHTSSGVLVQDTNGHRYMTAASHGFPEEGKVYHPTASGLEIGEPTIELTHTDIALVKLNDGVEFVNEPFENTVDPRGPFTLGDFVRAGETRHGDDIFLDSPFSGFISGTRLAHSICRIPSDDPYEPRQIWIRCHWVYLGQDSANEIVDGVCGSPIWDENNRVLGFFRYAHTSGVFKDHCLIVAADHILDKGYTVVSTVV